MREKETCHFWVGQFPLAVVENYFAEVWDENDPDREHTPLSAFARDQGVKWYDHDFIEYGWGEADTIQELVKGYSYSDQWAEELARRTASAGLSGVNVFVTSYAVGRFLGVWVSEILTHIAPTHPDSGQNWLAGANCVTRIRVHYGRGDRTPAVDQLRVVLAALPGHHRVPHLGMQPPRRGAATDVSQG